MEIKGQGQEQPVNRQACPDHGQAKTGPRVISAQEDLGDGGKRVLEGALRLGQKTGVHRPAPGRQSPSISDSCLITSRSWLAIPLVAGMSSGC